VPGRCPACDGLGYIDELDLGQRYQIQHCRECGHRWEYLFDADGTVVGLTRLDEAGQPVTRTRVRPRPLQAERPGPEEAAADDEVVDLRTPPPEDIDLRAPAVDAAEARHMSPAEWLRHAIRR
jgi:hypothetical protein